MLPIVAIIILVILLLLALVAIGLLAYWWFQTRSQLKRYQGIMDVEAEQARVKAATGKLEDKSKVLLTEQDQLRQEENRIRVEIRNLSSKLSILETEAEVQSYGLYEPKYDFGSAERYKTELDAIRQRQKQMIQEKKAVVCDTEWTVEGSKAKGKKMVDEMTKLMLRAFNGECDALILKVKYNNIQKIEERIGDLRDAVNKLGMTQKCRITDTYFKLKVDELHLAHEYQEKLQAEQEEQRAIRERMREEEIAQREMEKARLDAEKEEKRFEQALERARQEMAKATGDKHDKLQAELERLQQALAAAQEQKQRAISRAQMTRSGHVYVISNIGSFGEHVYKIGMTRRLVPEERIQELGDASVPFPFDIHAIIYSDDAPGLENELHKLFDNRRVNMINPRKEFFRVSLEEIKQVVLRHKGEIEFTMLAEAEEYRKTQALFAKQGIQIPTQTPVIVVVPENPVQAAMSNVAMAAIADGNVTQPVQ